MSVAWLYRQSVPGHFESDTAADSSRSARVESIVPGQRLILCALLLVFPHTQWRISVCLGPVNCFADFPTTCTAWVYMPCCGLSAKVGMLNLTSSTFSAMTYFKSSIPLPVTAEMGNRSRPCFLQ